MITIIDNILSAEECNELITLYGQNTEYCHHHNGTYPLNIHNARIASERIKSLIDKILNRVYNINKDIELEWIEIVKWPTGTFQLLHLDTASDETVFTSITYLNDQFDGGKTYMEDGTNIGIVTARTVAFDGMKYTHGVKEVTEGTRFTVAAWYRKLKNKSYVEYYGN
jgi:hypothetical protein